VENLKGMSGPEMKAKLEEADVSPAEISVAVKCSITTIYKIFKDAPSVKAKIRKRVVGFVSDLEKRSKASA